MRPDNDVKETAIRGTSRRTFLVGAGVLAAATSVGVISLLGCSDSDTDEVTAHAPETPTFTPLPIAASPTSTPTPTPTPHIVPPPWPYATLDPVAAAERGYAAYSQGGCMYGAFEGLVGELRAKVGAPFDAFPAAMMKYGKGGVNGWGTLCGALNGAAASIYLVTDPKAGDGLIDELFAWYGAEALPNFRPATPKFEIASSVAESPLCHVSVTTWCEKSGFKALSPERAERCAWLTASVAKHTAELLNNLKQGKAATLPPLPAEVTGCLACHGKGGPKENVHASRASSCVSCHEPHSIPVTPKAQ